MEAVEFSLILPAHNEVEVIEKSIYEADEFLKRAFLSYELIVVDDGSTDGTAEVARQTRLARVIRLEVNQGYGAALRAGFQAARGGHVAFTDADCQFFLDDFLTLIKSEADVAVGYRVDRQDPWLRIFLSRGYNWLARHWLGTRVRDIDCAMKIFRREQLLRFLPESAGFFVNTELLARFALQGLNIEEYPVRHRPRFAGRSKVGFADIPKTFLAMARFWYAQRNHRQARQASSLFMPRPMREQLISQRLPRIDGRRLEPVPSSLLRRPAAPREPHREST